MRDFPAEEINTSEIDTYPEPEHGPGLGLREWGVMAACGSLIWVGLIWGAVKLAAML